MSDFIGSLALLCRLIYPILLQPTVPENGIDDWFWLGGRIASSSRVACTHPQVCARLSEPVEIAVSGCLGTPIGIGLKLNSLRFECWVSGHVGEMNDGVDLCVLSDRAELRIIARNFGADHRTGRDCVVRWGAGSG